MQIMKNQLKKLTQGATKGAFMQSAILAGVVTLFSTSAALAADFNQDGVDDLVIGDMWALNNGQYLMGHAAVVTRQPDGSYDADVWTRQRIDGRAGQQYYAGFGARVATGDFNGDGYQDLAIAARFENASSWVGYLSGAVFMVYGTSSGLGNTNPSYPRTLRGATVGKYNYFGSTLTTGDFNGDGIDDLAVGAGGRNVLGESNTASTKGHGAVDVYFGSATGLSNDSVVELNQNLLVGSPQAGAGFGNSLASGDFNKDGWDDLLIGAPYADRASVYGSGENSGNVTVVFGESTGFNLETAFQIRDSYWDNNTNDRFGQSLVTLDYNGDGYDDFAIGHPGETLGNKSRAGAVTVYQGHANIDTWGFAVGTMWNQNKATVHGTAETADEFGRALAAGDFNNDGNDDLAIGTPDEDVERRFSGDIKDAGIVHVLYGNGSTDGFSSDKYLHQGRGGVEGTRERLDGFGRSLAAGDYDGDGIDDLMVGVSFESIPGVSKSSGRGMAQLITGGYAGLRPTAGQQQMFHKGISSINGMADSKTIGFEIK